MPLNNIKTYAPLFLTAVIGAFLVITFTLQHKSNLDTLEENNHLTRQIALKTLETRWYRIFDNIEKQTPEEFSWKTHAPDVFIVKNKRLIFPYRINNNLAEKQDNYHISQEHQQIIREISNKIKAGDEDELKSKVAEFLQYKINFQHHPAEEILAWLALIKLSNEREWSREFIERALLSGWDINNSNIASAADLLFTHANTLPPSFVEQTYQNIRAVLSKYKIQNDFLEKHYKVLTANFQVAEPESNGLWLTSNGWVIVKRGEGDYYAKEFSEEMEVEQLFSSLVSLGILNKADVLSINTPQAITPIQDIALQLTRKSHTDKLNNEKLAFTIKLAILALLTIFVILYLRLQTREVKRKENYQALQKDFINLVSHEVRTPLSAIALMAETIEKRTSKNLPINDYPKRIHDETIKFQSLLENMLAISQIDNGGSIPTTNLVISNFLSELTQEYPHLNFQLDVRDEYNVESNPTLFGLVFRNLISNAVKYNANEHVDISISLTPEENTIYFTDNGVGIPQEKWKTLFERFNRSTTNKGSKGLGIGLSLSRDILRKLGGDLSIAQSNESGTTWKLCLKKSK